MDMDFSTIKARIAVASEAGDRRRAQRIPVALEARMRPLGEEGREARLLNISRTGFMAESQASYEVGARVWLLLPGRERASALIKWVEGGRVGAEFAQPLTY